MKPHELKAFQALVYERGSCDYNEENKARFHRLGKKLLREIAKQLGLPTGSYKVSSCLGGIAVSGEVILHSNDLYVCMSADSGMTEQFMYRSCTGQKDYSGGPNNWMHYRMLDEMEHLVANLQSVRRKAA